MRSGSPRERRTMLALASHVDEEGELIARPLKWKGDGPVPVIRLRAGRRSGPAPRPGDRVLATVTRGADGAYDGRIIRNLGPARAALRAGIFIAGRGGGTVESAGRRRRGGRPVRLPATLCADLETGDFVAVETEGGESGGEGDARPIAVERLGGRDDPRAFSLIEIRNRFPAAFDAEALAQAERCRPPGPEGRVDLRDMPLVTIDGADARDFDDAVHAVADLSGGWELTVAIADVAYYVRPGDALDAAARERGNSVYFPDRVIPMLPERLSEDLCSLRPGEDRACIAARIRIDSDGRILEHRFERGLMRSAARLTYEQAQGIRDGRAETPAGTDIAALYGAWEALDRARRRRGVLELEIPEYRALWTPDGAFDRLEPRPVSDSNRLIEEFMVAANVAAAETLFARGAPTMNRIHEPPEREAMTGLAEAVAGLGLKLSRQGITQAGLSGLLEQARRRNLTDTVSMLILRAQSRAVYGPQDRGHFGLALRRYAHFTSPIRRYADLLVHRSLIACLGLGEGGLPPEAGDGFAQIAVRLSQAEREAAEAERGVLDRLATLWIVGQEETVFEGRVSGVARFGLFVDIPETGVSGLLPVRFLPAGRWRLDPVRQTLSCRDTRDVFRIGDPVRVQVAEADPGRGELVFAPAGEA